MSERIKMMSSHEFTKKEETETEKGKKSMDKSEEKNKEENIKPKTNLIAERLKMMQGNDPTKKEENKPECKISGQKEIKDEKEKTKEDKDKFKWKCIVANLNEKRFTYRGTDNEENPKKCVILKIITIQENSNYKALLKEVFLLSCLKKNKYFNEMIDVFLSKDYKKINIIMKKGGESLYDLIRFDEDDYNNKYPNCSQKIIFQIVCGLKVLHDIGFSHNDIKLGNISCTGNRKIKINDLKGIDKINLRRGLGTYGYNSPQCLLGFLRTKEDDMYSVGIVFVELLQKKCGGMLTKEQKEYLDGKRKENGK